MHTSLLSAVELSLKYSFFRIAQKMIYNTDIRDNMIKFWVQEGFYCVFSSSSDEFCEAACSEGEGKRIGNSKLCKGERRNDSAGC